MATTKWVALRYLKELQCGFQKDKHKHDLIDLMLRSPGSPRTLTKTPTFRRDYGWWDLSEVYQQLRDVLHSSLAALVETKGRRDQFG